LIGGKLRRTSRVLSGAPLGLPASYTVDFPEADASASIDFLKIVVRRKQIVLFCARIRAGST
jgi:hypothetical protein